MCNTSRIVIEAVSFVQLLFSTSGKQNLPPPPGRVTIHVSHHHPQSLPDPIGWERIQRNWRIWMVEQNSRVIKIDAAQYNMLLAIRGDQEIASAPTTQFLVDISTSCRAQRVADLEYYVHWSMHLLANIR